MKRYLQQLQLHDSILRLALQKNKFTGEELGTFQPLTEPVKQSKQAFHGFLKQNNALASSNEDILQNFSQWLKGEDEKLKAKDQPPLNYRSEIVQDNYYDINDRSYGNKDVMAGDPFHGTHVSGIIGAVRNNGKGINGIASYIQIMTLRAVPDGDEHDKDIALAIRYAVDNGAKIINMSFGKGLSPEKNWVDDAVRYAESKGVLLVHAAGNDHKNIDTAWNFPNPQYASSMNRASNWISVGASADGLKAELPASFSNYGKKEVDIFAPGVQIISTIPGGNKYGPASGTSMAAPAVTGVAAFLLSYYPKLKAKDLKYILETSAIREPSLQGTCVTGGLLNAYEAVQLADSYTKRKRRNKS
jgi:subtilisin family serine protease